MPDYSAGYARTVPSMLVIKVITKKLRAVANFGRVGLLSFFFVNFCSSDGVFFCLGGNVVTNLHLRSNILDSPLKTNGMLPEINVILIYIVFSTIFLLLFVKLC